MNKTVILGIDGWYPQVDGGTNVVLNYREWLKDMYDCYIVAPSYGKKADEEGEKKYCAGVFHNFSLGVPGLSFRNSVPGADRALKRFLKQNRPDVLHAHSPFAICGYFARYAKKAGVPLVYTFHTRFKDEFMRVTKSRLATAIMMSVIMRNIRRADYVWAVSKSSAETLREYGYKGEIKVMRNGSDMPAASAGEREALAAEIKKEYGISPDERVFIYSGRVVKVKNLAFSFKVLSELSRRGVRYKFLVVGGGDELEEHKKLAAKCGIAQSTVFTGYVGDRQKLRAFYAAADLLLFPSTFDTFGLVVQEAAAMGTPSLVVSGSGAAELIEDGVNGYAEEEDVARWADKVLRIFSDGSLAAVQKGCADLAYTWKDALRDVSREYERIMEEYKGKKS